LLAATSLVASFLGARAIDQSGVGGWGLVPLLSFILFVVSSVYVLAPKRKLEFALRASEVWERRRERRLPPGRADADDPHFAGAGDDFRRLSGRSLTGSTGPTFRISG
jgi:hypothetical protein